MAGSSQDRAHPGAALAEAEARLARVRVVLVHPRGALNAGAVARIMKNMGLRDLVLVKPAFELARARVMAVHARDLIEGARIENGIAAAVADCGLVVGTTARTGQYRAATESPERIAPLVLTRAAAAPVALVFGPEDHGLDNDDLKVCQRLMTIPTSVLYPSLNLAQAVAVCCYELRRCALAEVAPADGWMPAAAADVELALAHLQSAFSRIGFLNPQNPDHVMLAIRRMLGRAGLDAREVRILRGLARQIEWFAANGGARPDGAAPHAEANEPWPR